MKEKKSFKRRKKVFIFFLMLVVIFIMYIYVQIKNENADTVTDYDRIAKIMVTTRKTDVFIVGETIDFNDRVETRVIDEVTESKIDGSGDYKVIIINDLNDEVVLSEKEIEYIRDLIEKDYYMIVYLGAKYSATWDDSTYGIANVEGNLCYIYYSWDGEKNRNIGLWNDSEQEMAEEYPLMLGESLLLGIEEYLQ